MGTVRRVFDLRLQREVALKMLRPELAARPEQQRRFFREALVTSRLQHPGIPPVHDLGFLEDGRPYFTMKEVRGQTLGDAIHAFHAAGGLSRGDGRVALRRLVEVFRKACDAVAFAHAHGVVHRDLKPANVLLGEHGEVQVVDWGIARVSDEDGPGAEEITGVLDDDLDLEDADTRVGAVMGTRGYMAPEQARGENEAVDARADVYALGTLLYMLLYGRRPDQGELLSAQVTAVEALTLHTLWEGGETRELAPAVVPPRTHLPGADLAPLGEICERALQPEPCQRFANAGQLAAAVGGWLDGVQRRQQALAVVADAQALTPRTEDLAERVLTLRREAEMLLEGVPSHAPEDQKAPAWKLLDQARDLELEVDLLSVTRDQLLHAALTHEPDLPEAHAALAAHFRAQHIAAEAERRLDDAVRLGIRLRTHAEALPEDHPDRRSLLSYLKGDGVLTLRTRPEGAEVFAARYTRRGRRLVTGPSTRLGRTPLVRHPMPMGSYMLWLRARGWAEARYPVLIGREAHWDGEAPGGGGEIALPRADVGGDLCFIPPGWFLYGGDPEAALGLPLRRLWTDAYAITRHPVTHREYVVFLEDLQRRGLTEYALGRVPRSSEAGPLYLLNGPGQTTFPHRPPIGPWGLDHPVTHVTWHDATAYADWLSKTTGQRWRLPSEVEWEKAARGTDGRSFPWGETFDPSWACSAGSHADGEHPCSISEFALDESPFGVRGLSGNVRDWCLDDWSDVAPPTNRPGLRRADEGMTGYAVIRGGSFRGPEIGNRLASRFRIRMEWADPTRGFRLVREVARP